MNIFGGNSNSHPFWFCFKYCFNNFTIFSYNSPSVNIFSNKINS